MDCANPYPLLGGEVRAPSDAKRASADVRPSTPPQGLLGRAARPFSPPVDHELLLRRPVPRTDGPAGGVRLGGDGWGCAPAPTSRPANRNLTLVRRGGLVLAVRRAPPGTQLSSLLRREHGGFNVSSPVLASAVTGWSARGFVIPF